MAETAENSKTRKILKGLGVQKLKFLSKKYGVNVKGSIREDSFGDHRKPPSKTQYVNALAKHISEKDMESGLKEAPKQESKETLKAGSSRSKAQVRKAALEQTSYSCGAMCSKDLRR